MSFQARYKLLTLSGGDQLVNMSGEPTLETCHLSVCGGRGRGRLGMGEYGCSLGSFEGLP